MAFERRAAVWTECARTVEQALQPAPITRGHARAEEPVVGLASLERASVSESVQGQGLETPLAELVGMGIETEYDAAPSWRNAPAQPAVILGASLPKRQDLDGMMYSARSV
jgi:hypothetical protein